MRRRLWLVVAVIAVAAGVAHAELPTTLEEFQTRVADQASDPQKAVKLFFDGIFIYLSGEKELGKQCIIEMSRYKEWTESQHRMLLERMESMPHIYRSYAEGATPDNAYEMNPQDYKLVYHGEVNLKPYTDRDEGAFAKLFIVSGGADAPRSLTLQRNNAGQYKVYEFSTINLDIRPIKPPPDASLGESKDPKWVMRRFFEGIILVTEGQEQEGIAKITSVTTSKTITSRIFLDYMKTRPWMFGGFMKGTSPDNGYKFDHANWELNYVEEIKPPSKPGERTRAVLKHSGADISKPIYLIQDERGEYRISDYSNVYSSCRPPADPNAGNF
jgi:hypothetical protein